MEARREFLRDVRYTELSASLNRSCVPTGTRSTRGISGSNRVSSKNNISRVIESKNIRASGNLELTDLIHFEEDFELMLKENFHPCRDFMY